MSELNKESQQGLDIEVTTINGVHTAKLTNRGQVLDTMACEDKQDIGWICRELLTWYSKTGGISKWAESARKRHAFDPPPVGKVYHSAHMPFRR